jgi:hypothetical protein
MRNVSLAILGFRIQKRNFTNYTSNFSRVMFHNLVKIGDDSPKQKNKQLNLSNVSNFKWKNRKN